MDSNTSSLGLIQHELHKRYTADYDVHCAAFTFGREAAGLEVRGDERGRRLAGGVRYRALKRVAPVVGAGSTAITFAHRYLAEG